MYVYTCIYFYRTQFLSILVIFEFRGSIYKSSSSYRKLYACKDIKCYYSNCTLKCSEGEEPALQKDSPTLLEQDEIHIQNILV